MRWLENLAHRAGFTSLRRLAARVCERALWPRGEGRIVSTSVAAKLNKLQRGVREGVTWWEKRPWFQDLLAKQLEVPVEELRDLVRAHAQSEGPVLLGGTVPFDPESEESLFPGAPEFPFDARLLWWVPPSDSEAAAVLRWLKARHGFEVLTATWPRARDMVSPEGATVLRLTSREQIADLASLNEWPGRLWVVAPFLPSGASARPQGDDRQLVDVGQDDDWTGVRSFGAWTIAQSPRPHPWREALCRWIEPRLRDRSRFDPGAMADWLDTVDSEGAVFSTVDTVCGLAPSVGDLDRSAHSYMEAVTARLKARATEVLRSTLERLIARGQRYTLPREREKWVALLDESCVRDLIRRQHLVGRPDGVYALTPRWALDLIAAAAAAERLESGATAWGPLLLVPETTALVLVSLVERFRHGDWEAAEQALDGIDPRDAASVAAVEAAFRAAGLAELLGGRIARQLGTRLWRAQMGLVITRYRELPPVPRVGLDVDRTRGHPLLDLGTWFLAALSLSEHLNVRAPPELAPWRGRFDARRLSWLLSMIDVDRVSPVLLDAAYDLGCRLMEAGIDMGGDVRVSLQWPGAVVRAAASGDLERLRRLMSGLSRGTAREFATLQRLVKHDGIQWSHFARAVWQAWQLEVKERGGVPPRLCWPTSPAFDSMWRYLPKSAFDLLWDKVDLWLRDVPKYTHQQWRWIVRGAIKGKRIDFNPPWHDAPWSVLREVLELRWPYDRVLDLRLWLLKMYPEKTIEVVQRSLAAGNLELLWEVPYERTGEVSRMLEDAVAAGHVSRAEAVRWLHVRVEARASGWEDLYDRLAAWAES